MIMVKNQRCCQEQGGCQKQGFGGQEYIDFGFWILDC